MGQRRASSDRPQLAGLAIACGVLLLTLLDVSPAPVSALGAAPASLLQPESLSSGGRGTPAIAIGFDQGMPGSTPSEPPSPAAHTVETAPAPKALAANWIAIPRLGLRQPVGWYSDCLGRAPVPRWGAWRWSCAGSNNTYIMAHNPGVFTPLLELRVGDLVAYSDPAGHLHIYRVTMTTVVADTQLWPLESLTTPSLTLQTCWVPNGSRDLIVRAAQVSA